MHAHTYKHIGNTHTHTQTSKRNTFWSVSFSQFLEFHVQPSPQAVTSAGKTGFDHEALQAPTVYHTHTRCRGQRCDLVSMHIEVGEVDFSPVTDENAFMCFVLGFFACRPEAMLTVCSGVLTCCKRLFVSHCVTLAFHCGRTAVNGHCNKTEMCRVLVSNKTNRIITKWVRTFHSKKK